MDLAIYDLFVERKLILLVIKHSEASHQLLHTFRYFSQHIRIFVIFFVCYKAVKQTDAFIVMWIYCVHG